MFIQDKTRLIAIIGGAVALTVAVLVGVFAGINANSGGTHPSVNNEKFQSLVEGMTAPDGVPPNGMMITPATESNWYSLFPYISRISFLNVPYEAIAEKSTHFISISANGTNNDQALVVGSFKYPVFGVAYETPRDADNAKAQAEAVASTDPEMIDAKFFTKGNILYYMVVSTYVDDQMSIKELPSAIETKDLEDWGIQDGESYWYIDFDAFLTSYKATLEDERYGEGIDKILTRAGFTQDSYWVGTSQDLIEWDGKLYNVSPSSINPEDLIAVFGDLYKKVNSADPTEWEYVTIGQEDIEQGDGFELQSGQGSLSSYIEVATKRGSAGRMTDVITMEESNRLGGGGHEDENIYESPTESTPEEIAEIIRKQEESLKPGLDKLPSDSPFEVKLRIDPNAWVGLLKGGQVADAPRVIYMKSLTAEIKADGTTKLTIDPYTMEEYAAEIRASIDPEKVKALQEQADALPAE